MSEEMEYKVFLWESKGQLPVETTPQKMVQNLWLSQAYTV